MDAWRRNRIGDRAKNELLEEEVAFANAYGGTLVLGVRESDAKPPVACRNHAGPALCRVGGTPQEVGVSRLRGTANSTDRDFRRED